MSPLSGKNMSKKSDSNTQRFSDTAGVKAIKASMEPLQEDR